MRRTSGLPAIAMRVTLTTKILLVVVVAGVVESDENGRYVPDDEGRYYPDNSGEYIPDYSGRYIHDPSGRYKNDGTGRYKDELQNGRSRNLIEKNRVTKSSSVPSTTTLPTTTSQRIPNGKYKIIRQVDQSDLGGYHWEYETENNILAEETAKISKQGKDSELLESRGFFKYTGPDNVVYSISYTADDKGFLPEGKHIPTEPPLPDGIARALDYQRRIGTL